MSEALQATITGEVFVPGDDGYDNARRAFFLNLDQRPSLIVLAESSADVVRAVQFARAHGRRIAPQSTGHGAAPLEPLEDAMLLKTSRMRRVEIAPATRMARAEAGAQWQDVTVPAAQYGLAALAGTSPNVGVAGYTLGGGIGWLGRCYGLAANNVTAVELVTVDGLALRVDAGHEPDLFWAVRGGGGSVGVVTALEMTLFPVPELYAGVLFFGIERSSFASVPAPALQALHMDPADAVAAEADGALLSDFGSGAIEAVLPLVGPNAEASLASFEVRHLGGALARKAPGCGAQPRIDAPFAMVAGGPIPTPELRDTIHAHVRAVGDALAPWRAPYDYYNFRESPAEASAVLPRDAYLRLQEIKAHYDPDEAIISAHPVRPTGM
jgi:FAD/FMN-containing dehydrogenase